MLGEQIKVVVTDAQGGQVEVRTDLYVEWADGTREFIDSKYGPNADLEPNQAAGYPILGSQGGRVYGPNAEAAGFEHGEQIDPTRVVIKHWNF